MQDKYKDYVLVYKGYTLIQTDYNYHFTIYDKNGCAVMHVQHTKPLTKKKAKKCIKFHILLSKTSKEKKRTKMIQQWSKMLAE